MRRFDKDIDEVLISKKWIIFTGGQDNRGSPLLTFPTELQSNAPCWTADELLRLLTYMTDVVELVMKRKYIAFVCSLQCGITDERITTLVHTLQKLEIERQGTVAVLYILKPKSKSKKRALKKLLGLKEKKDQVSFVSQFKTVLLKSLEELHTQIDPLQLTEDYGGNIAYDHSAWMFFDKMVLPNFAEAEEIFEKLTDIKDKTLLLQEYDASDHSSRRLHKFLRDLRDKYGTLLRESGIISSIEKCKQTLHLLNQNTEDNILTKLHQALLMEVVTRVRFIYGQLVDTQQDLDQIWEQVEGKITTEIAIEQRKEEANKLCNEISERYWPMMTKHPGIAEDIRQAESYRTQFRTTLYEPAKVLISKATMILLQLRKMMIQGRPQSVRDIVMTLTNIIQPFTQQLNNLNDIYVSVHVFFFVSQKIVEWYFKALDFVPNSLCSRAMKIKDNSSIFIAPTDWCRSADTFRRKHPPPRPDHIAMMNEMESAYITDIKKNQAKIVANRCRCIASLFRNSYLDVGVLRNIFSWKKEHFGFFQDGQQFYINENDGLIEGPSKVASNLSRHVSRSKSIKGRYLKKAQVFECHDPFQVFRKGPSVSSTDTEHRNSISSSTNERFVSLNSSFDEQNDVLESQLHDVFEVPSMTTRHQQGTGRISRKHSFSDWSLFSSHDYGATGSSVDNMNYVSSPFSDNERKIKHVSNLLSSSDFGGRKSDTSLENGVIGISTLPARNRATRRRRNKTLKRSPAQTVSELNKRLSRSLDNVLHLNHVTDPPYQSNNDNTLLSSSMLNVCDPINENELWKSIETPDSLLAHSRCSSWRSVDNVGTGPSSRSAEDTDDTAPISYKQHHRPSRVNTRRKRRGTHGDAEIDTRQLMNSPGVFRRNSEHNHARSNYSGYRNQTEVHIGSDVMQKSELNDVKDSESQESAYPEMTVSTSGNRRTNRTLSTNYDYDSSNNQRSPESFGDDPQRGLNSTSFLPPQSSDMPTFSMNYVDTENDVEEVRWTDI